MVSLPVNITTAAYVICSEETGANLNMQNRRRMVFLEVELVLQSELDNFEFCNKFERALVSPCTALVRAELDPAPLCCDHADG